MISSIGISRHNPLCRVRAKEKTVRRLLWWLVRRPSQPDAGEGEGRGEDRDILGPSAVCLGDTVMGAGDKERLLPILGFQPCFDTSGSWERPAKPRC